MEVYLDVLILENTLIDLLLLLLTFKLTRIQYGGKVIYLSALLGGMYTVVTFSQIRILGSIPCSILILIMMMSIAIKNRNVISILKLTITYLLLNFMLAGICFALVVVCNNYEVGGEFTIYNYSIKYLILALSVLVVISLRVYEMLRERAKLKSYIYDIYIARGEKTLSIKALLDTGNVLREQATNLPCIIIENQYLERFNVAKEEMFTINYKTISENSALLGFRNNNIKIRNEKSNHWITVEAIICGCKNKLSIENEFQGLLSRGVI